MISTETESSLASSHLLRCINQQFNTNGVYRFCIEFQPRTVTLRWNNRLTGGVIIVGIMNASWPDDSVRTFLTISTLQHFNSLWLCYGLTFLVMSSGGSWEASADQHGSSNETAWGKKNKNIYSAAFVFMTQKTGMHFKPHFNQIWPEGLLW